MLSRSAGTSVVELDLEPVTDRRLVDRPPDRLAVDVDLFHAPLGDPLAQGADPLHARHDLPEVRGELRELVLGRTLHPGQLRREPAAVGCHPWTLVLGERGSCHLAGFEVKIGYGGKLLG
ncbi:MAG TPA: hypothetical protein VFT22_20185 [Kofleriaceae bacterium]|nr:hypothetical protein [Kofleriaceae bacterium]